MNSLKKEGSKNINKPQTNSERFPKLQRIQLPKFFGIVYDYEKWNNIFTACELNAPIYDVDK